MLLVLFKKWVENKEDLGPILQQESDETLEQKVLRIQAGDTVLRNEMIEKYRPFIAKMTSICCKKYIDPERDDEFSIALHAFNEAINEYRCNCGASFLGFARTVIRRRLIDHIRREERHLSQIPLSTFDVEDEENHVTNPVETEQAIAQYELEREAEARKEEIADLAEKLESFGISFSDLTKVSPKHSDSRRMLFRIAKILGNDRELMDSMLSKKMLPIKPLLEKCGVSRKTLERNRKYLIALALIHTGHYPYLQQYLYSGEEENGDA
mgnify:CR=1 FL=1